MIALRNAGWRQENTQAEKAGRTNHTSCCKPWLAMAGHGSEQASHGAQAAPSPHRASCASDEAPMCKGVW